MKNILLSVLMTLMASSARADLVEVANIYYNINQKDKTASVASAPNDFSYSYYTGAIDIPATIEHEGIVYDVTSVGEYAFQYNTGVTSVTFPESLSAIERHAFRGTGLVSVTIPGWVTTIGYNAFGACPAMESITVDGSNTAYDSRGDCNAIIETATGKLINGCMNTVIPSDVTRINRQAFESCIGLKEISIPDNVTSIDYCAFQGCI